jgi:hypothetical protein
VTQTSEIPYGAEIRIDPIPHRDSDATQKIRDGVEFNNGISAGEIGLGNNALVSGLLTAALNDGEVLADDGSVHESVQAAQDAASSYIFVGPGTFNESVTIDTPGLTVQGSGHDTLIDGGTSGSAIAANADDVTLSSFSARSTNQSNFNIDAVRSTGTSTHIANVFVDESDSDGIRTDGVDSVIKSCTVEGNVEGACIAQDGNRSIIDSCIMRNTGLNGISISADDCIASNNNIDSVNDDGWQSGSGSDLIVIGNRIHNVGNRGVAIGGFDVIVANNRISDSTNNDILDVGAGTVLDGNNTGSAN